MRKLLLAALLAALAWPAAAQNAITQGGTVVANHPSKWVGGTTRQLMDAGGLNGDVNGRGFAPFSITDGFGCGLQFNTLLTTNLSNQSFCFGHSVSGDPILNVNGTVYALTSVGGGTVTGPVSSAVNEIVLWNNTLGSLVKGGDSSTGTIAGLTTTGNVAVGGALTVTGNTTLGNAMMGGTFAVSNNATIGATLTATTVAAGTLTVSANSTLGGTLNVTGDTGLGNTNITGVLTVSNNATVGATLGATTVDTTTLITSANATIGGTLGVTGNTTLGNATVSGTLGVTGNSTLTGNVSLGGTLAVSSNTTMTGGLTTGGTNAFAGNTTVGGTLGVTGATTLAAAVVMSGLGLSPGGNQAVCINTGTGQLFFGAAGVCPP